MQQQPASVEWSSSYGACACACAKSQLFSEVNSRSSSRDDNTPARPSCHTHPHLRPEVRGSEQREAHFTMT